MSWLVNTWLLPVICWCTTPSRLPTTAAAAHPNKMAPFLWACGTNERLPRHFQSPTYVDPWAAQGLETPPRTSTSHLALDPKRRPPSAQPRSQLTMATCPRQRTMEATHGNGCAPAWGSLVMMMMMLPVCIPVGDWWPGECCCFLTENTREQPWPHDSLHAVHQKHQCD